MALHVMGIVLNNQELNVHTIPEPSRRRVPTPLSPASSPPPPSSPPTQQQPPQHVRPPLGHHRRRNHNHNQHHHHHRLGGHLIVGHIIRQRCAPTAHAHQAHAHQQQQPAHACDQPVAQSQPQPPQSHRAGRAERVQRDVDDARSPRRRPPAGLRLHAVHIVVQLRQLQPVRGGRLRLSVPDVRRRDQLQEFRGEELRDAPVSLTARFYFHYFVVYVSN